ncbi:MAG: hypothetical protein ACK41V_22195 [Acidovorax sp.]|uniref:hypothetical protein n=1 Tax=Acidovorax sp. TaxID=1872122 RepID=UPI00391A323E
MTQKIKATGHRAGYSVVQWSDDWDPSLTDLMECMPNFVVGRRVAIASCDSGKYRPSATEFANGWEVIDGFAVSPPIASASELPMPGFDEWYVYDERPNAYIYRAFVNQFGFSPLAVEDPRAKEFWAQVDATRPLHVLGAGTPVMFVVTRDANLFAQVSEIW